MPWNDEDYAAFDFETSGELPEYALQPWRVAQGKAWPTSLVWLWREGGKLHHDGGLFPDRSMVARFLNWAIDHRRALVGWNTVFDISWLYALADEALVNQCSFVDGMLLWRHLDIEPEYDQSGRAKRSYSLKLAVPEFLPKHAGYEEDIDYHTNDAEKLRNLHEYNIKDCAFTLRLARKFWLKLTPKQQTAAIVEAKSLPLVAYANLHGLIIDKLAVADLSQHLKDVAAKSLDALVPHGVTEEIARSPTKLASLMFDVWGLVPVKENTSKKTGKVSRSTDKEVLHELAFYDKRAKTLRAYREALNCDTKFAEAPKNAVAYNQDGRAHPMARVFGAYCVTGDVEVLTRLGWVRLDQWSGGDIMQVREDLTMEFLPADQQDQGIAHEWVNVRALKCRFTRQHTMPYLAQKTFQWKVQKAEEWLGSGEAKYVPVAGYAKLDGHYSPDQMRLFAAVQADGHSTERYLKFTFVKPRKIARLISLLNRLGIQHRVYTCSPQGYSERTEITIAKSYRPEWCGHDKKFLGPWLFNTTQDGLKAFVDEVVHWDGSRHPDGGVTYQSAIRSNLEWVATAAALVGYKASVHATMATHVSHEKPHRTVLPRENQIVQVSEQAYCPSTRTGFWLARSQGRIFVTGNTGRLTYASKQGRNKDERQIGFALHQEKRDSIFRRIVVPPRGYTLVEFDAAGQEFRWMAIAAKDPTMLKLCGPGQDPHSFMGAKIANKPYAWVMGNKDTDPYAKNARKSGKVANLSLQYRTSAMRLLSTARVDYGMPMTKTEAYNIHRVYLSSYPMVPVYWGQQIERTRMLGYVETFAGRRVKVVGNWSGPSGWQMGSTAINYRIQGTGADQKYLALMMLADHMHEHGVKFAWDLHDGLYFYVPDEHVYDFTRYAKDSLDNLPYKAVWGFSPPIEMPWDAKVGPSWGDLKDYHFH